MKRDPELCRSILLALEADSRSRIAEELVINGVDRDMVNYHILLLQEAGLLVAHDVSDSSGRGFLVERLTWSGHEFLDAARKPELWERAKPWLFNTTFEALKQILVGWAVKQAGL